MSSNDLREHSIGWIGMGRMGFPMAERLVNDGCDVMVWNRTRSKAEPLAERGAQVADSLADLAQRDVVFSMVSTGDDLQQVLFGDKGLLSGDSAPGIVVDCSSIAMETSAEVGTRLRERGIRYLCAPVSGNGKCVKAGKLAVVASGPQDTYDEVRPYLAVIGGLGVTYVGDGDLSRVVKICHNIFLAVVTQSLAEITVLAEKSGIKRHAFLQFINESVMGSIFTKYKTPGWVNQDYAVTFTPELLRKDMDLGLALARAREVPMPSANTTRDLLQSSMGRGNRTNVDFGIILKYMAESSGLDIQSENVEVPSGLEVNEASDSDRPLAAKRC